MSICPANAVVPVEADAVAIEVVALLAILHKTEAKLGRAEFETEAVLEATLELAVGLKTGTVLFGIFTVVMIFSPLKKSISNSYSK